MSHSRAFLSCRAKSDKEKTRDFLETVNKLFEPQSMRPSPFFNQSSFNGESGCLLAAEPREDDLRETAGGTPPLSAAEEIVQAYDWGADAHQSLLRLECAGDDHLQASPGWSVDLFEKAIADLSASDFKGYESTLENLKSFVLLIPRLCAVSVKADAGSKTVILTMLSSGETQAAVNKNVPNNLFVRIVSLNLAKVIRLSAVIDSYSATLEDISGVSLTSSNFKAGLPLQIKKMELTGYKADQLSLLVTIDNPVRTDGKTASSPGVVEIPAYILQSGVNTHMPLATGTRAALSFRKRFVTSGPFLFGTGCGGQETLKVLGAFVFRLVRDICADNLLSSRLLLLKFRKWNGSRKAAWLRLKESATNSRRTLPQAQPFLLQSFLNRCKVQSCRRNLRQADCKD